MDTTSTGTPSSRSNLTSKPVQRTRPYRRAAANPKICYSEYRLSGSDSSDSERESSSTPSKKKNKKAKHSNSKLRNVVKTGKLKGNKGRPPKKAHVPNVDETRESGVGADSSISTRSKSRRSGSGAAASGSVPEAETVSGTSPKYPAWQVDLGIEWQLDFLSKLELTPVFGARALPAAERERENRAEIWRFLQSITAEPN